MELKQLEAFVHVAELGSFTRAAAILDMTQPALSRLVRQLEIDLRQHLLIRNGRGVALTEAGQVLLEHGKGILQQVERAHHDLQNLQGTLDGKFSIGLAPSVAKFATMGLIRRFQKEFPRATITVAEGLSSYLTEWLMMGRIDAAILYDTSQSPLIDKRILFTEELFLIGRLGAAPKAPKQIQLSQIGRFPLVIPSRMHAIRALVETQAAEVGVKLNIAMEVDSVSSVLELVDEGDGYAILSLNAIARNFMERKFSITRIVSPTILSRLTIATSKQHPLSRLATRAVALLEDEILPLYELQQKKIEKDLQ